MIFKFDMIIFTLSENDRDEIIKSIISIDGIFEVKELFFSKSAVCYKPNYFYCLCALSSNIVEDLKKIVGIQNINILQAKYNYTIK